MKSSLIKFENTIIKIFEIIIIILTVSLFAIVAMNVIRRYIFNNSIAWADELSRYIFVWVSIMAATLAYKDDEHMGLDILTSRIKSRRVKIIFNIFAQLAILLVLYAMVVHGKTVAFSATNVSPAIGIPITAFYMIVPVSAAVMVFINIKNIVKQLLLFINVDKS